MFLTNAFIVTIAILIPLVLVAIKTKSSCTWSRTKVFLSASILLTLILGAGHWLLSSRVRAIDVIWSPDNTRKIVFYQLPHVSFSPGSGSDGPGLVKVFDEKGKCLNWIKFDMIQSAQVTWFDDAVEIGSTTIALR